MDLVATAYGFHDGADQSVCCGVCEEDRIQAEWVMSHKSNRAGQAKDGAANTAYQILVGSHGVERPESDNNRTRDGPYGDSGFHVTVPLTLHSNDPTISPKCQTGHPYAIQYLC